MPLHPNIFHQLSGIVGHGNNVTQTNEIKSGLAANGASPVSVNECPNCRHPRSFHKKKYEVLKDDKEHSCTYLEEYVVEDHLSLDRKTKLKRYATRGCICTFSPREIDLNAGIVVDNPRKGETF